MTTPTKKLDTAWRDLYRDNSSLPDAQITRLGENKPRKYPWVQIRLNEVLDRNEETMGQVKVDYEFIISIIGRGTDRDAYESVFDEFDNVISYTENNFTADSEFHNSRIVQAEFEEFAIGQTDNQKTPFVAIFATMEADRFEND